MPEPMPDRLPRQLVVFRVGPTRYALDIESVDEILRPPEVTKVPRAPGGVLGLVDVRGRVLPVFDLHWRFGLPCPASLAGLRLIVVEIDALPVALLVDAVDEVATVDPSAYQSVSTPGEAARMEYLAGVVRRADDLVLWIDHRHLVSKEVARTGRKLRVA